MTQKFILTLALALAVITAGGCGKHPRVYRGGELSATEAVAGTGGGASRISAAFLSIRNRAATADVLVGATSPKAEAIEFHETVDVDGTLEMRPATAFAIASGERLALAPGRKHLMVFGLDPALKTGDRIPLILTFRSGTIIEAEMELVADASARFSDHAAHHSGAHDRHGKAGHADKGASPAGPQ